MTTKVTNIYNLKLTPSQFGQSSLVVNCSQYDSLFRVIQFNLFNGNAVYSIPEGSVVTIRGTKKDNTGFEYECDYSNNVVTFPLQQQITIFPGKVPAELRITNDGEIIGSWNFLFLVEESPLSDNTTISETQLPLLEQAIEAAGRLNEAFDDIAEFTDETYPNAVQAVQNEGATQVANVTNEGTTQRGLVTSEGATQIANIQAEGATQVGNVQAKGTEVLESIPSDYTELSGEVENLKSDLDSVAEVTATKETVAETVTENIFPNLTWSDGYMGTNGSIAGTGSNTYRHSQIYPVTEGDVIAFENPNFSFSYITAFNGQNVVQASGQQGGNSYTVPNGIDGIVISEYVSRGTAAINHTHIIETVTYKNILDDDIENIEQSLDALEEAVQITTYTEETTTNIYPNITWTEGKYINLDGLENTSSSFRYSNKIPVSVGDVIKYFNANFKFRFVTAYSGETAVSASGVESSNSYTVPSGIDSIVLSDYISRGSAEIDLIHSEVKKAGYVNPIPLGYMTRSGSLSAGDRLTLPYMQVKNNNRIVFNANITSFSSVKYALGNASVEVNTANLIITNASETVTTVAHGLTIGSNITLIVESETEEYISHVRISSDGYVYDYNTKFYAPSVNSAQYVQSIGSTLTECVLSWVSTSINAPIWVFGDSYISFYDERWTYYLIQDGYDKNAMFNGFAGQASDTAYTSLVNLLATTTPKQVVWCLGMNDPDTSDAVNASWYAYYLKLIELKKKYGFELILYTVPTTPTMNNNYKNAVIRSSGYRYIEADKAVRINDGGEWVTGALAGDNVHPTQIGAKILYYRILADLPELMSNY